MSQTRVTINRIDSRMKKERKKIGYRKAMSDGTTISGLYCAPIT